MRAHKLKDLRIQKGFNTHDAKAIEEELRRKIVEDKGANLTPEDLKNASFKRTSYTMLENGKVKSPPKHIIEALSKILNVNFDEMKDIVMPKVDEYNKELLIVDINRLLINLDEQQIRALYTIISSMK